MKTRTDGPRPLVLVSADTNLQLCGSQNERLIGRDVIFISADTNFSYVGAKTKTVGKRASVFVSADTNLQVTEGAVGTHS